VCLWWCAVAQLCVRVCLCSRYLGWELHTHTQCCLKPGNLEFTQETTHIQYILHTHTHTHTHTQTTHTLTRPTHMQKDALGVSYFHPDGSGYVILLSPSRPPSCWSSHLSSSPSLALRLSFSVSTAVDAIAPRWRSSPVHVFFSPLSLLSYS